MEEKFTNRKALKDLLFMKMPYGKYKGRFLIDIPEHYIVWYRQKGFPKGKLGEQLQLVYEIKLNGLEDMMHKLKVELESKAK
jgi:uncharacterized protein (DUF3820 family)